MTGSFFLLFMFNSNITKKYYRRLELKLNAGQKSKIQKTFTQLDNISKLWCIDQFLVFDFFSQRKKEKVS